MLRQLRQYFLHGWQSVLVFGRFVKFEHSVFSIPMFFAGALVEGYGWPPWRNIAWMIVAGVGARTVAMALNRLIDRGIDARNPRTTRRELPAGAMSVWAAYGVTAAGLLAYTLGAWALGGWCLKLMWVPLVFFLVYPFMKRYTAFCHVGVGLSLGLAPLGGAFAAHPASLPGIETYLLVMFTTLWVTGFDIIYATLDEAFDRETGMSSAVVRLGQPRSLQLALWAHVTAMAVMVLLLGLRDTEGWQWLAAVVVAGLFTVEHWKRENVDFAFFQVNSIVGFFVLAATL